ncbi:MAG: topoisomerase C-terminal repeat-containing protein [Clostridia bacterium]|nr:topoisomerase C-terminal repeat-containing protein [Clostridia bacterium]
MTLIIAEKPSLARNIVAGIGKCARRNGYFEGEGYLVTWAFGHLFSLCDIEDYTGPTATGRWSMENIPCFPEQFRFQLRKGADKQPDEGVQRQFELIRTLCARTDVDKIVNAGDADREGEIIIRLCVQHTGVEKPFYRLWLPDQTPETVAEALSSMKEESAYQNLADEGFARTYVDWLYGVNLTRYATLKTGVLLRVGRVIVPIVKAIYDRDKAIENFIPEIYYAVVSNAETKGEPIELTSKQKFDKNSKAKAEEYAAALNACEAVVTEKKKKKTTLQPGKLFSLSKLQNVLGKKYKMPMEESLKLTQELYEAGYITYPRTNSEYLAEQEKGKIKNIINKVAELGYQVKFRDGKSIFDDSKIESHSALTPTHKIPKKEALTERQMLVYQTIFRRFAAVFCAEDCLAEKAEMVIKVGELEEFRLKGTVIVQPGWTRYDDGGQKNKLLPPLEKGDRVNIDFAPKEKETSPPRHYTIETLNNYLKNPFREEKAAAEETDDREEYRAMFEGLELGTEATRTGIIGNAIKSQYIALKKDTYHLLKGGEYLIEELERMGIAMDKYKTSMLGQALKKVYRGELQVADSVAIARDEIALVFAKKEQTPEADTDSGLYGDEVGTCPLCGGRVVKGRYGYGCLSYKEGCKFRINGVICKRVIPISAARALLKEGKTQKLAGFTSKKNTLFDASLKLEDGKVLFDFQ